jgi:ABC-type transporter Mla MlaB component
VSFGQASLVALEDFDTSKTNPIKLTLSLQQGALADLQNFQLDAQTKQSTPYYLTIQVSNVGTATIDTSGFAGLLTVNDAAGDQVASLTLLGDFPKCDGEIPDTLAPGASAHECDVYTAPQGQQVSNASIDNGTSDATITWS